MPNRQVRFDTQLSNGNRPTQSLRSPNRSRRSSRRNRNRNPNTGSQSRRRTRRRSTSIEQK